MTAPIVSTHGRELIAKPKRECREFAWNHADTTKVVGQIVDGQLWERLAEQEVVPTARLGAALIRADVRVAVSS